MDHEDKWSAGNARDWRDVASEIKFGFIA